MGELDHRFYEPGVIAFSPDLVEGLHAEGNELAMHLDAGDASLLPHAVEGWLTFHSIAANGQAPGILRGRIAAEIDQPPYDYEKARRIGLLIRDTIRVTDHFGEKLAEAQRKIEQRLQSQDGSDDQ